MLPNQSRTKLRKTEPNHGEPQAQQSTIQFLVGPSPKGPKLCLRCRQPFKKGEAWQRYTSPPEPRSRSYAIGIHDRCLQK